MVDLLPSTPDPSAGDGGDPRVIGVDSEDAADLLAALQSETARDILTALYDDPASPSALAETADTSIQNARYHLEKLADADLVEVADTVYSEKGREMKVYAPAATPLVVFAGGDDDVPGVEAALSRLLGALGILGLSSLLVQRFFGGGLGGSLGPDFQGQSAEYTSEGTNASAGDDATISDTTAADADSGAGPNSDTSGTTAEEATEETRTVTENTGTVTEEAETTEQAADATEAATETARTTAEEADAATTAAEATQTTADAATTTAREFAQSTTTVAESAGSAMAGLPPGLAFFLGGAVALAALGIAWYVRAR